jgi:ATP-binding cassette subfamily F protein uup
MNLLSVNNLSKSYGPKVLFKNISFGISHGDKVALVAKNGSGKSTLFKIMKGIEIPDEGEVVFRKDISVAFLDQDPQLNESQNISELIKSADNPFVKCIRDYEDAVTLSEKKPGTKSAQKLENALHRMNELNAWDYEKDMKEILSQLGLNQLTQTVKELSGGQKKRVALALVLINRPDLIFMDEPTNHLDIEMIEWLEHYLSSSSLSMLIVTHDRYFLDEVCDKIIEIDDAQLYEYKGNFEYYLQKKAEREQSRNAEIDKARNLYRRELEWVRKMPKARGTKAKSRVNAFYDTEQKAKQKRVEKKIELSVKMERLGSKIVELHKVSKSFAGKKLLDHFTYTFVHGEKVGIIGKNGIGKSTLLKIIQGQMQPDAGKVQVGDTVVFGYYSQEGIKLNNDLRIIEVVRAIADFIPMANGSSLSAAQLLTRFNFPPDVQYSYVSKLSGGEKRRLYLLTILMKNPNFLILDEPTNDLDIVTLQTLEEFLDEFKGCVLIVSHDRYFIDRLVDHVFAFEGDGVVKDYPGNYTEYREWKKDEEEEEKQEQKKPEPARTETKATEIQTDKISKKLSYKVQRELEQLEAEIPELEEKKKQLEQELAQSHSDYAKVQKLSEELQRLNDDLDSKSLRWIEIQELI